MKKFVVYLNDSSVSLRLLEWFCGNYAKKNNTTYKLKGKDFNVYNSYKSYLNSYQKRQYDPFKRKHKGFPSFFLPYTIKDKNGENIKKELETTVCQCNFFKWAIGYNVLEYLKKHQIVIQNDMIKNLNYAKKKKGEGEAGKAPKRKKREQLSKPAVVSCIRRYTTVKLDFN